MRFPQKTLYPLLALSLLFGQTGCLITKKNEGDQSVFMATPATSPGSTYNPAEWAACDDQLDADLVNPGAVVTIPYYINSVMLDPATGNVVCTPRAIREKIKKAFDLYASIPEAGLQFKYMGPDPTNYSVPGASPYDNPAMLTTGLYIILSDGSATNGGQANMNWYWGLANTGYMSSPTTNYIPYPGGTVTLTLHGSDGSAQWEGVSFGLIMHEIGHALGLDHIPARSANMSRYTSGFRGEYYSITETERAAIAGIMPAAGKTVYRITGTVNTSLKSYCGDWKVSSTLEGVVDVLAVDITNGRTYAALAHCQGTTNNPKFWINIPRPGSYRLVTIPDGFLDTVYDTTSKQASWYIDNTTSTNDPTGGTVITLNDSNARVSNVVINMLDSPSAYAFNASWIQPDPGQRDFNPAVMNPGGSGVIDLTALCGVAGGNVPGIAHCDRVTAIEPYGTAPDYSFSDLTVTDDWGASGAFYSFKVSAHANATPGHRIAIGRAANGVNQVALVGLHILGNSTPAPRINQLYTLEQQFQGLFDFSALNPLWWR